MEQEEKICDEMEKVIELTFFDGRVSAGGGCEVALTARTRCGWVAFRECGELLYDRRFPLMPEGTVCKSYVRPATLY